MKLNKKEKDRKINILYVVYANLLSKHAHVVNIIEMCNAFSIYANLTLIVPYFFYENVHIYKYYGIDSSFDIKKLFFTDFLYLSKYIKSMSFLFFHASSFIFSFLSLFYVLIRYKNESNIYVYTRNPHVALVFSFFKKVIYDVHSPSLYSPFFRMLERIALKRSKLVIFSSYGLMKLYTSYYTDLKNINFNYIILPNGINLRKFSSIKYKVNFKNKYSKFKYFVGYVGSAETLGSSKGLEFIIYAAKELPEVLFFIIGLKNDEEFERYRSLILKENINNIILKKRIPHFMVPAYLQTFDLVLLPLPENLFNTYFISPIKLFEYMVLKKCVISSYLPSIKYLVSNKEVLFYRANDLRDFISKIKYALTHKSKCAFLSENAYHLVKRKYTWKKRAKAIIDHIIS